MESPGRGQIFVTIAADQANPGALGKARHESYKGTIRVVMGSVREVRFGDRIDPAYLAPKGCATLSRLSTISLAEGWPVMAFLIASLVAS